MSGKIQVRLAVLAALAALAAVMVPGGLASGSHSEPTDSDFTQDHGVLRLELTSSASRFLWNDGTTNHVQTITQTRCEVGVSGASLVSLTSNRKVGLFSNSLGVKTGGAQGVACSRISSGETLTIALASSGPLAGVEVAETQLDIELKMGAEVQAQTFSGSTLLETFKLRSGSSIVEGQGTEPSGQLTFSTSTAPIANCRQPSDSGPDAGALDNCRWVIRDMIPFDKMVFTSLAGEYSIEGGNDGTPTASDGFGGDSLFFLSDIDGVITCGDSVNIGDSTQDTTYGTVTLHSMDVNTSDTAGFQETNCLKKPFVGDTAASAISFVPDLSGTSARYTMTITVEDQPITTDGTGQITSLIAEYDPAGGLTFPDATTKPLQSCRFDPEATALSDPNFWTQASPVDNGVDDLLPPGEMACFYHASVTPTGLSGEEQVGTESWKVYFEDDPGFGFR